jgi:hypothetical protein
MSECNKKKIDDCKKNKVMKYCDKETGRCIKNELGNKKGKNVKKSKKSKDYCKTLILVMKEYLKNNTYSNANSKLTNDFKKCIEAENIKNIEKNEDNEKFNLYPLLEDENFNEKLMRKSEYKNMVYHTPDLNRSIKEVTDEICNKKVFELNTHQTFVQNFMSSQTPYNSLLLFHGLGTGKTCSAISCSEEYREYLKQDVMKKIIVVAKPNILENFKYQLFPTDKLKKTLGIWNINQSCIGNKLIKEVNPHNIKNLPKNKIIKGINKIISNSYDFMGYVQFSNYITKVMNKYKTEGVDNEQLEKSVILIKKMFSNRMIIIDEVHNIRDLKPLKKTNKFSKKTTDTFQKLVSYSDNMKLLLLTATPMFDSYKEILWLLNLMNLNDNRFFLKNDDVFDNNGKFKKNGKELLIQKMTGYISFVKGEDPYYFPFRIYPKNIKSLEDNSLQYLLANNKMKYPKNIINKQDEKKGKIKYLDLYLTDIGNEQDNYYKKYIELYNSSKSKSWGYTEMDGAKQILNMSYPIKGDIQNKDKLRKTYGKIGLIGEKNNEEGIMIMKKNGDGIYKFEYNEKRKEYMNVFEKPELKKYSGKLNNIMNLINDSEGITLIYSQYIYGGCIPLALALEHEGYLRYKDKNTKGGNLFKKPRVNNTNVKGKYIMITGDNNFSPRGNNKEELLACNKINNKNGEIIKVVIISAAGSEGLDFKNIRNVHILEPWYNLYRQAQVEGRAIRNLSHCQLKFENRNTTIFLHGTNLNRNEEAIDLHIYRIAEKKAIKIGEIANILKENAVDCLLNKNKLLLTKNKLNKKENITVSYGPNEIIEDFEIGYSNNSLICGFMDCDYKCKPSDKFKKNVNNTIYNENIFNLSIGKILQRIRMLFKEKYLYDKPTLFHNIKKNRKYDDIQIYQALNILIDDKREFIEDMLGRQGYLNNIGNLYIFKPIDLDDDYNSIYNIKSPIPFKNKMITIQLDDATQLKSNLELATYNFIKDKYNTLSTINKKWRIKKQQLKNWEIYYSIIIHVYSQKDNGYNIELNKLKQYGFDHIFEMLNLDEKVSFLNELSKTDDQELKMRARANLNKFIINHNNKNYITFKNPNKETTDFIYELNDDLSVIKPAQGPIRELLNWKLIDHWTFKKIWTEEIEMNIPIGFIGLKRKKEYFKIKQMDIKKWNKGQTCEQGFNKNQLLDILKKLLNVSNFPWLDDFKGTSKQHTHILFKKGDENTIIQTGTEKILWKLKNKLDGNIYQQQQNKNIYQRNEGNLKDSVTIDMIDDNDYIIRQLQTWAIQDIIACISIELLLRYYDDIKKNGKRWFFTAIENKLYNIENLPKLDKLKQVQKIMLKLINKN